MVIELSRKSGIPLYIQLKEQIAEQINKQLWQPGYKLPTEREMATMAGVSRNTVSMAYKELETENLLVSHQGKGTFVANNITATYEKKVVNLIDVALDEALKHGYSLEEFQRIVESRIKAKDELFKHVKIIFIECNHEQVDYFAKELSLGSGVQVIPYVLHDILKDKNVFLQLIKDVDFIVTTFFHTEEIKEIIGPFEIPIISISLEPQLETIVRIARLEKNKTVGLVCLSDTFAKKVHTSIENAGISHFNFCSTTTHSKKELEAFIERCDYILTSPGRNKDVIDIVGVEKDVVEFVYRPDVGSVSMLKEAVLAHQKRD